jgi:hypothetical protein
MADDVGRTTDPDRLQRVHSASEWPIVNGADICQSESSKMVEDDVFNPRPQALGVDHDGGNGAAAVAVLDDDSSRWAFQVLVRNHHGKEARCGN